MESRWIAAIASDRASRHYLNVFSPLPLLFSLATLAGIPVWAGKLAPPGSVKGEYCNIAVVRSAKPLVVRSGPGWVFQKVGTVASGATVYTCNEAADLNIGLDRHWIGIAYKGSAKECAGATNVGLPVQLSRQCLTGWVEQAWIETLTG